jgi:hypothetical protein
MSQKECKCSNAEYMKCPNWKISGRRGVKVGKEREVNKISSSTRSGIFPTIHLPSPDFVV